MRVYTKCGRMSSIFYGVVPRSTSGMLTESPSIVFNPGHVVPSVRVLSPLTAF